MPGGGCNILIANPRDIAGLLKTLARQRFHSFPAVNTLFNAILQHADFAKVDWRSLKISVGGGMTVQASTAKLWLDKTGCPIVEGDGLSETSPSATCNPVDSEAFNGSVDEQGYFRIVDRKKDMILISGFNVDPNAVEEVILQMAGVLECAAVGVPDERPAAGYDHRVGAGRANLKRHGSNRHRQCNARRAASLAAAG